MRGLGRNTVYFLCSLPALLLHTLLFAFPLVLGVYFSLTDWDGISRSYRLVGLSNYINILHDSRFLLSLRTTLLYTVLLVLFTMGLSLLFAMVLNMKVKWNTFFRGVYFYPSVLSMLTVGLIFRQIFYHVVPTIGEMTKVTWLQSNLLGNPKTALYAVLFVHIWQGLGIPLALFLAGLQTIPEELLEAAKIDGAGPFQRFRTITLPFLVPVSVVVFILTFRNGLIVFDVVRAMTDGGPGRTTEVIGLLIYEHGFYQRRFAYATAEAVVLFFVLAIVSFLVFKTMGKRGVEQL